MAGIIGKKIGMTSVFSAEGKIYHAQSLKQDHVL